MAGKDHEKAVGMWLRIDHFGDQCTGDASVAKYARAKRTWRSGHYFYEPLVSGGNIMGDGCCPRVQQDWSLLGDGLGRCFRTERRAFPVGPCMLLRQATEVKGNISFVFYIGLR